MNKWVFRLVFCPIILLIVLFLITPSLLSTSWGNRVILSVASKASGYQVDAEQISLSWFGSQTITELEAKDVNLQQIAHIQSFSTKTPLIYWLFGSRSLGETNLSNFYFHLGKKEKQAGIQDSLTKKKKGSSFAIPYFRESVKIEEGTIVIEPELGSPFTLDEIHLEIDRATDLLHFKMAARQGGQKGSIVISGNFGDQMQLLGQIESFPLTVVDSLLGTEEFSHAFGPVLHAQIEATTLEDATIVTAQATTGTLKLALTGKREGNQITFDPNSVITYSITPSLFARAVETEENRTRLADKSTLTVMPTSLSLGKFFRNFNFNELAFKANFALSDFKLIHADKSINLSALSGKIEKDTSLNIRYHGTIGGVGEENLTGRFCFQDLTHFSLQSSVTQLPTHLLEALFESDASMLSLVGRTVDINVDASAQPGKIDGLLMLKSERGNFKVTLKGKRLKSMTFAMVGTLEIPKEKQELFGSSIALDLGGTVNITPSYIMIPEIQGGAKNKYISVDLHGKIGDKTDGFSAKTLQMVLDGRLSMPPMLEKYAAGSLSKPHIFSIKIDGPKNEINANLSSEFLDATLHTKNFIYEGSTSFMHAKTALHVDAKGFPIEILNAFVPGDARLETLFGKRLDLTAKALIEPENEPYLSVDLDASAEGFRAVGSVQLDGTLTVSQANPTRVQWEITPERYLALLKICKVKTMPTHLLAETSTFNLSIDQFICPKETPTELKPFLCKSGFIGAITFSPLLFSDGHTNSQIENLTIHIEGEDFSQGIQINTKGQMRAPYLQQSHLASFTFDGQILNLFSPDGHFDPVNSELRAQAVLDSAPVDALLGLLPIQEESFQVVSSLLGDLLSLSATLDIQEHRGPISLDVHSSNLKAVFPLYLNATNTITLREAIQAEISLTEKINRTFLIDINPLLITGVAADHPISCTIEPQGFSFPIFPFLFSEFSIGQATIDIGKIVVRNGGQLQELVAFVQAPGLTKEGLMEAWFTPIYMQLKSGVAYYKRFDLRLAGTIHLAFWGNIDLIQDQVHMVMAIAPSTLKTRFNVSGLSEKDMFQVKMTGPTSDVSLDWKAASTRIGVIIATSAGGKAGSIVGAILNQILTLMGSEPTPPPSTQPFPWTQSEQP